jgi:ABC-2 type transport system permease protein
VREIPHDMRMDGQPVYGAGSYTSLLLAACSDSAESDNYIGYVGMGIVQTAVVLLAAEYLFDVPFLGPVGLFLAGISVFIIANVAVGFTFPTIAQSQMQALQMAIFFFLPSMLFSSFMFPFRGIKAGSQTIGEIFPLTHFLRVVRSVMLKGGGFAEVQNPINAMLIFTGVAVAIAMLRHRRTLD